MALLTPHLPHYRPALLPDLPRYRPVPVHLHSIPLLLRPEESILRRPGCGPRRGC
jgi:hypothetical protein